jgi:hypothetical protein
VHYDAEPARRPCFHEAIRAEAVPPGWGVDDGVGLLFAGTELVEAVSARRHAGAYWVEEARGAAVETALEPRALPGREELELPIPLSIVEWREARVRRR